MGKFAWVAMYWLSRAGLLLPRRLIPTRVGYAVAERLADLAFALLSRPRETLVANLTPIVGSEGAARQAARGTFRNFGRYVVDLFQLPALDREVVRSRVDFEDWCALTPGPGDARGTIFVTLHLGQWEMGAAALAASGYPVSVVAQTLDFKPMNDLVQGFRRSLGMRIIPGEKAVPQMFRCLARNEMLGMLIDVVEPGEGIAVKFFGKEAEFSTTPARIAMKTGARVVAAVLARDSQRPDRLHPTVDTDVGFTPSGDDDRDVKALTQALATSFEHLVRRFPDQWFAFRPVWQRETNAEAEASNAGPRQPVSTRSKWDERRNHLALTVANAVFSRLPKPMSYQIGDWIADRAFEMRKGMQADVMDNMRHVLGASAPEAEIERVAREAVRNVCRYYCDLIRLPHVSSQEILEKEVTLRNYELLTEALAEGRGVVLATAHFGNPEAAVQASLALGLDVLVLSETLEPPEFSELVHRLRSSNGARYVEVGFQNIGQALRHLRAGGCLAITCDRDIQGNGTPLAFFGTKTPLPLGAAELAARTGAALMPAYCRRLPGGKFEVAFERPIDMVATGAAKRDAAENAQRLLARAESWIRSDPGQWMVLERIWRPISELASADSEGPPRERELAGV